MNGERRGPWYLLTGLIIGAFLGLGFAWLVQPVRYTNTFPASLRADHKDRYRAMIAAAYMANPDLVRAKARLALLEDEDPYRMLAEQAQRSLAQGNTMEEARALGALAAALAQGSAPVQPTAASQSQGTIQETPLASTSEITSTMAVTVTLNGVTLTIGSPVEFTPVPTRMATATPGGPFVLTNQQLVCDQDYGAPIIQIFTFNSAGQQVPAVEIVVTWEGGENHFYTGLKPEVGPGYADFTMTPGVTYSLRLAIGGQPINDLKTPECENESGKFNGAWRLEFIQP